MLSVPDMHSIRSLYARGFSKRRIANLLRVSRKTVDKYTVREDGRVIGMALVVAIGVSADGEREVLGLDLGPTEEAAFWQGFPRGLVERGLRGAKLVVSDAPKAPQPMVAALVRMIFIQADQPAARASPRKAVSTLERRYPKAAALLADAEDDILAHMALPERHRRRLHSTNPL